jgi:catechol 2,3-dioxygenase-like lactoylglutathione lyase family enzyme
VTGVKLIPELYCSDIERSLAFYTDLLGFEVLYSRPEESFYFLIREGAELMLDHSRTRRLVNGETEQPFGRGLNLQIQVSDVKSLHDSLIDRGLALFWRLEEKWYRRDDELLGNWQFVVADPDGYLLRFYEDLGRRPVSA